MYNSMKKGAARKRMSMCYLPQDNCQSYDKYSNGNKHIGTFTCPRGQYFSIKDQVIKFKIIFKWI